MAITTGDQLLNALANNSTRLVIDKASLANQVAGRFCSLWRATGEPPQGAIPGTTAAVPTRATTGALPMTNQTPPAASYLAFLALASSNNTATPEVWDRIGHVAGLVLNVTTLQTISGMDIDTLAPGAERIGASDLSDLQWWLEVYADGGATASNATINVTYDDASTGNLNLLAVGGTLRIGQMLSLNALIPAGAAGRRIRGVNSIQLSASTGTAGNVGITVTRPRTLLPLVVANKAEVGNWEALGLPEIPNDACLMLAVLPTTTSSGTLRGGGKIAHG